MTAGTILYQNMSQLLTDRIFNTEHAFIESIENQAKEIVQLKKLFSSTNLKQFEINQVNERLNKMDERFEEIRKRFDEFDTKSETGKIRESVRIIEGKIDEIGKKFGAVQGDPETIGKMEGRFEEITKRIDEIKNNAQANEVKERLGKLENTMAQVMENLKPTSTDKKT